MENYENVNVNEIEETEEAMIEEQSETGSCGINLGGVALGAGLVAGGILLTKLVKKGVNAWKNRKSKKDVAEIADECDCDEDDVDE